MGILLICCETKDSLALSQTESDSSVIIQFNLDNGCFRKKKKAKEEEKVNNHIKEGSHWRIT